VSAKVWRYHLPSENGEGWAIVFLDSIGCFTALSDWGNYGHRWPEAGWGPGDFRDFFVRCDDSYVIGKIARSDEYHGERTAKAIKARIIEYRHDGVFTKQRARREWELLREHDDVYRPEHFALWWDSTKIEQAHELAVYDFPQQAVAFMKRVMPRLRDAIRADLAREAA
jgi:hypothetical protein